ncbi:AAA family ATPase [uncultured Thiodictyon sp.]|uniref:AAA family ATPase n=1 Tax=uncultured Thiodictyon sp. TaxID=1846217 RepID=UPI0025D1A320|nr:AAA family ATPase [uncultured Thiodictyon sp.]
MPDLHDLELLLRSAAPIILIESVEEPRVVTLFAQLALRLAQPAYRWSVTDGLRRIEFDPEPEQRLTDPTQALRYLRAGAQTGVYLLLDFHPYLDNPLHVRLLKEIAQGYEEHQRTLVLVSYALAVPPELRHLCVRCNLHLPDRNRILALIREEAHAWKQSGAGSVHAVREAIDQLAQNLLGITESDARRLIRNAIRNDGAITVEDVAEVKRAKYELLSPGGTISFEYDTRSFADVAGLANLKAWVERRRKPFLDPARTKDYPRGILLLGVQGGGKSLAAKAVAGCFGVPLLRLDCGALYDKYIGETEKNLRQALASADQMAPCCLWIDEIEKGIAIGPEDEGVGRRVLGTLLTWMAERNTRVFLVATANDITRLPPELVRKGRIDELFFVDLPDADVRAEVFAIHLRNRGLDPAGFDLPRLAQASEGFTGAGIEQAVVSALYAVDASAQPSGRATPDTNALLTELARTQPLSVVMAEQIEALRDWARERCVPAHGPMASAAAALP